MHCTYLSNNANPAHPRKQNVSRCSPCPSAQKHFRFPDRLGKFWHDKLSHFVSLPSPQAASRPILNHSKGSVAIGRSPDNNQVVLDDVEVSRWHARLDINGSNVMLSDLNSANGTFINGTSVSSSSFGLYLLSLHFTGDTQKV